MTRFHFVAAATLTALGMASGAVVAQAARLDGSASASPLSPPSLAAQAASSLQRANVPSTATDPMAAGADSKKPNGRLRLKAERQNLKGDDAAHAMAQRQNPSTYDRSIQNGDADHTEQVTDMKVTIHK